jgi:hypothetical protein
MSQSVTTALPTTGRAWHLTARPQGWPTSAISPCGGMRSQP